MSNKKNSKRKIDLKQLIVTIIIITLLVLFGQNLPQNNISNNVIKENLVADTVDVNISDIPKYSGETVITINNDIPYFEDKDISTENFEYYSNLDEYDRAGVAFANVCKYTMPPEGIKRESLSYKPTGWVQYLYGENNSKHLYERCHLIAWQLSNENNNKKNLITGTSQMNSAMIEYENKVANWIKNKNNQGKDYHVLYRVTPIYNGENKLATGVELEAKSVEEEGIAFNKLVYNVQDNFEIDYNTGKAKMIEN